MDRQERDERWSALFVHSQWKIHENPNWGLNRSTVSDHSRFTPIHAKFLRKRTGSEPWNKNNITSGQEEWKLYPPPGVVEDSYMVFHFRASFSASVLFLSSAANSSLTRFNSSCNDLLSSTSVSLTFFNRSTSKA
jgi:hypothetical protein